MIFYKKIIGVFLFFGLVLICSCTPKSNSVSILSEKNNCTHDIILYNHPVTVDPEKIKNDSTYSCKEEGLNYKLKLSDCIGNLYYEVYNDTMLIEKGNYVGLGDTLSKYFNSLDPETYIRNVQRYDYFGAYMKNNTVYDFNKQRYREQSINFKAYPFVTRKVDRFK